ncbi:conserved hypothetical protein [Mycobacterium tuberculosis 94_M4241A]|nr:conserved hypothetical protein [Mycobacterium tuberculosis 94_M4241A]
MTENPYLVGLRLAGKKVVVVGGGTVAQRRLPLLIASGADVHVIAPSVTPAVEAMDQITLSVRDYRDGDLDGAWYAIAATDDAQGERGCRRRGGAPTDFFASGPISRVEGGRAGEPGVIQANAGLSGGGASAGLVRNRRSAANPLGNPGGVAARASSLRRVPTSSAAEWRWSAAVPAIPN